MGRLSLVVLALLAPLSSEAREDCQLVPASCTQMHSRCEARCQTMPNYDRCMAATCTTLIGECKASGVWNPRGAAACYKTRNRS